VNSGVLKMGHGAMPPLGPTMKIFYRRLYMKKLTVVYNYKRAVSNPICRRQNAWSVDHRRCRRSHAVRRVFGF